MTPKTPKTPKMTLVADNVGVLLKDRAALRGVSVALAAGSITAIVGPNGAGKSTLLRTLAGLRQPTTGHVTLDTGPIGDLDRRARARALAFLPQNPVVHWPLSVRAVVALGRLPHRSFLGGGSAAGESTADREAIDAAMTAMDVTRFAARSVAELSAGERARVLFARALAQEARILLADEPTAGLDPAHALDLFAVLQRLAAAGRTVAVVLHDLSLAARFCHFAVILAAGRVVAAGPAGETLTRERLTEAYGTAMAVGRVDGIPIVVPLGCGQGPAGQGCGWH